MSNLVEKIKCPQCLKLVSENEMDNCDNCEKGFCEECLIYYGKNSELVFCKNCKKNP